MPKPNLWNVPLVDVETGLVKPEWRAFFQGLDASNGEASAPVAGMQPNQLVMTSSNVNTLRTIGSRGSPQQVLHGNPTGAPTYGPVRLDQDVAGNLPPSRLNGGTGASSNSFWRGDETWAFAVQNLILENPAEGLLVTQETGPSVGQLTLTFALANDLSAVEGLSGTGIAVRTSADTWAQRTITGTATRITLTNGDGVSGNPVVDIAATYVGQASITTLGTIGTGVWQGTAVAANFGGTGIANNAASTITISGAFASTFTMTGTTAVTFPTSGTLATTAQLPVAANPSASVGLTAVNGSATTFMRSDGAPALSQGISPTWSGTHAFSNSVSVAGLVSTAGVAAAGASGFSSTTFASNVRNPIWRFANADAFGMSYFQGSSGVGGLDTLGVHFGTASAAGSMFQFNQGGTCVASGSLSAAALIPTGSSVPANGVYLPAANTLGLTTNGTEFARVDSTGKVAIGTTNADGAPLRVVGAAGFIIKVTGGTPGGLYSDSTQIAVTGNAGEETFGIVPGSNQCYISTNAVNRALFSSSGVSIPTAGTGLSIKEGSNCKQGLTGNLVAGTLVVNNTSVTANSRIQLTRETPGGTLGHISYAKAAGTSFTITSTSVLETSTFVYSIFEPS